MEGKELKLFIWEDVLTDYSNGIMFALAEDSEEARDLIEQKMGFRSDDLAAKPKIVTEKEGFYVYGGG